MRKIDKNKIVILSSLCSVLAGFTQVVSDNNKLTTDGGEGSGNHGHKGRPGERGGSGKGKVSESELRESIVEALLGHEEAGFTESKKSTLEKRTTIHLMNSYEEMIKEHGPSKKDEVSKVGEMIKEFKGESSGSSSPSSTKGSSKGPSGGSGKESKAPTLPKKIVSLWSKSIPDLHKIAGHYIDNPEHYTRHALAIKTSMEAMDAGHSDSVYEDLHSMCPEPHKAPDSFDKFKDMHATELAYRAKVMAIKDWDKLTVKELKVALPKAYEITPPDSHVVKTVKPVIKAPKGEESAPTNEQPIPLQNKQVVRGQDSFMSRYVPPDKTVESYREAVVRSLEFHAGKNSMSVEEYTTKLNKKCQDLIDKCDLKMRIRPEILLNFILHNGGRFKNQFETMTSGGCLSTNARSKCEKSYWDIHKEADGATRPIYGYMYSDESFDGKGPGCVHHYGGLSITFKPEVKKRATVGTGDTLNNHRFSGDTDFLVKPVTEIDHSIIGKGSMSSLSKDPLKAKSLSDLKDEYVEAQIFGPTTVHDIAHVSFCGQKPDKDIVAQLGKLGIPWHTGKDKE